MRRRSEQRHDSAVRPALFDMGGLVTASGEVRGAHMTALRAGSAVTAADRVKRDQAVAAAGAGAGEGWRERAIDAVRAVARSREHLTSMDVWNALDARDHAVAEPRAMGAVMQHAAKLGIVEATDRFTQGKLGASNARPFRVWRRRVAA